SLFCKRVQSSCFLSIACALFAENTRVYTDSPKLDPIRSQLATLRRPSIAPCLQEAYTGAILMNRVYLDYNATTPVEPQVLAAMLPYSSTEFGNAASIHTVGQRARAAVETARDHVAALLGARSQEIIFTSGGTESDNHAIFGIVRSAPGATKHIITTNIEHEAVLNTCQALEKEGIAVTYLPVNSEGVITVDQVEEALRPHTVLITVMHANNELGTLQPLAEIGKLAAQRDIYFHTDAVQSAGKLPLDVKT